MQVGSASKANALEEFQYCTSFTFKRRVRIDHCFLCSIDEYKAFLQKYRIPQHFLQAKVSLLGRQKIEMRECKYETVTILFSLTLQTSEDCLSVRGLSLSHSTQPVLLPLGDGGITRPLKRGLGYVKLQKKECLE